MANHLATGRLEGGTKGGVAGSVVLLKAICALVLGEVACLCCLVATASCGADILVGIAARAAPCLRPFEGGGAVARGLDRESMGEHGRGFLWARGEASPEGEGWD
jgi:hypothetical protein